MTLAQDETREWRRVSVALVAGDQRQVMTAAVLVFLDPGEGAGPRVCTSTEVDANEDWTVAVYDSGSAIGHWRGESSDAPGHDEWSDIDKDERILISIFSSIGTPYDRTLPCEPIEIDGASGWEVCLSSLVGIEGHLIVPNLGVPTLESL